MRKSVIICLLLTVCQIMVGQSVQNCIVTRYNKTEKHTAMSGVQVTVSDAGTRTSGSDGMLTLNFKTLKAGDRVSNVKAVKSGYEIFNKKVVEQWNISRTNRTFELVMVNSEDFKAMKDNLTENSKASYKMHHEQDKAKMQAELDAARKELEKMRKENVALQGDKSKAEAMVKAKEAEVRKLRNDIFELEERYDDDLQKLDTYVDQFARIDLSLVEGTERKILQMMSDGKISEAVKAYEELNLGELYRKEVENKRQAEERKRQAEAAEKEAGEQMESTYAMVQRQIQAMRLEGGKENYDKIVKLMKEVAEADTTNFDAVWDYADFAQEQKMFDDAKRFYLIALGLCKDEIYKVSACQNNLGNLYNYTNDYGKAEEYFKMALENYTVLFKSNPDAYRPDLATTQNNLGNLYRYTKDYGKAEEYYKMALENYTVLFKSNPDAYRPDLAMIHNNLGGLYSDTKDYGKAEEYLKMALENYTVLFKSNPDAYRPDLATTQNNLGYLYLIMGKPIEAVEMLEKSYSLSPGLAKEFLAMGYNSLAYQYAHQGDYAQAIGTIDKAIGLMPEEPNYYDSKGEILLMKGDTDGARQMYDKVLELDTHFFENHESELFKKLQIDN